MSLPNDNNIISVALRRMAVLSDEPREVRARADTLADVFEAQDVVNEDESPSEWMEEPEARAWARRVLDEVVPMIDGSSVFVSLVPREEVDIKFAVETGLALPDEVRERAWVHSAHAARHGHPGEPCRDRSACYPGDRSTEPVHSGAVPENCVPRPKPTFTKTCARCNGRGGLPYEGPCSDCLGTGSTPA